MKINKTSFFVAGVALFGVMNAANAADGTVNFIGEITDETCTIDTGSQNLTVNLGKVSKSSLDGAAGKKSSPTGFQLNLTSCPATVTGTTVKFDGTADSNNSNLLKLTQDAGVATGVGIEIADKVGTAIPLYSESMVYPLAAGSNSLNFVARYVSTLASVTTGPANGVTQFTLNYQ
ncbi:fimbrial protein [Aeromonas hydrophila]|uniref:fimbrial protein n=1 Tax=Aeromonas TaxID=642 RepID=UPI00191DB4E8|nr:MULTISPECIES: fimbrial protein [Aeromonas]MBL0573296.1 fimbrial protein [Aeromonas hydrophila]MDI3430282.1 fimbrial protein [Aeromonas sp. V90_14]WVM44260.1 fimbrial protein [Aeromonas hydrophila]